MEECKHEFIGHDDFIECQKCGLRLTTEEYTVLLADGNFSCPLQTKSD